MQTNSIDVQKQGKAMEFPITSNITKHMDWETGENL